MFELLALVISGVVLYMFGVSRISLMVIAAILLISFIFISTLSFLFTYGLWFLLAYLVYYYFFQYKKDKS